MNPMPDLLTDPLPGIGLTLPQTGAALVVVVGIIQILSTLANSRPGRQTCGAPRRGHGRYRRPLARDGSGCGVHPAGWATGQIATTVVTGALVIALLLNLPGLIHWLSARTSST